MNSNGDVAKCMVPSYHGVLSLSHTCPAALQCTRSSDIAKRVHGCCKQRGNP